MRIKDHNLTGASLKDVEHDIEHNDRAAQSLLRSYMGAMKITDERKKKKEKDHETR